MIIKDSHILEARLGLKKRLPQCLLNPRAWGPHRWGGGANPRARVKLAIGNELWSVRAEEIRNTETGNEAGVLVYFYWSLSCEKCVAFSALGHGQSGGEQM